LSSRRLSRGLLRAARQILSEARGSAAAGVHYRVVRQSQEAAELALKAALAALGVEYPRRHSFGGLVQSALSRAGVAPERVEAIARQADALAAKRGIAFYGVEEEGIPPDEALTGEDAAAALRSAEDIVGFAATLVDRQPG